MTLSVAIITLNEERNLRRTLASVQSIASEIIVVDSGSTDQTVAIARELGAKVFCEPWKGYAAQKNLAIEKCGGDWILSLDADEELSGSARSAVSILIGNQNFAEVTGWWIPRMNYFLGRHIRAFDETKLRLFRRGCGRFKDVPVHEVVEVNGPTKSLFQALEKHSDASLLHHAYPTLDSYIEHMNRYSSLGAGIAISKGHRGFSFSNIVIRPLLTFLQKYVLKRGFLDGREGLLLCLYHSVYVSWKYAKAWERSRAE